MAEPHWPAPVSVVSALGTIQFIEIGLGDRCVAFVAAGDRCAFILDNRYGQVYPGHFLQPPGPDQGRGPPELVNLPYFVGDIDIAICADLLHDQATSGRAHSGIPA